MQLLHGRGAISILIGVIVFVVLRLIGLHFWWALVVAVIAGPVLANTAFKNVGDRLEHWLTTMR